MANIDEGERRLVPAEDPTAATGNVLAGMRRWLRDHLADSLVVHAVQRGGGFGSCA